MYEAAAPPSVPPLKDGAMARPRKFPGSDSTAVLRPPGKVTPSPNPRRARAAANPMKAATQPCEMLARLQIPTPMSIPTRSPLKSSIEPHSGFAMKYATKKKELMDANCCALSPVSERIVGASTDRICRWKKASQEQAAIATHGIHIFQVTGVFRSGNSRSL